MGKHLLVMVVTLVVFKQAIGQSFYDYKIDRKFIGTLSIGSATYYGDIQSDLNFAPSTGQLSLEYNLINRLFVRVEGSLYWISASDAGTPSERSRGAVFGSRNVELSLIGAYHLFPTEMKYYKRKLVNPYVLLGVGATYFNPKATYEGERQSLRKVATEIGEKEWTPIALVIPFGAGIRMAIGYTFDFSLEGAFRLTTTDYLDAVSLRGNPNSKDIYWIMAAKLGMYLPYDIFKNVRHRRPKVRSIRRF